MKGFVILAALGLFAAAANAQAADTSPNLAKARTARDSADTIALQAAIDDTLGRISQSGGYENNLRLALLEDWMCEVAYGHDDSKLVKQAAERGLSAAETAAKLRPESSEAHWLTGELLGLLIPHVIGGGFRYGARSSSELDKAIALDPRNADAYVSRATNYFFTPEMFGGSKQKAIEMLQKAVALEPSSDAADTAHIWSAQVYDAEGKHDDAVRESTEAVRLEPQRRYAQYIYQKLSSEKNR